MPTRIGTLVLQGTSRCRIGVVASSTPVGSASIMSEVGMNELRWLLPMIELLRLVDLVRIAKDELLRGLGGLLLPCGFGRADIVAFVMLKLCFFAVRKAVF